MDGAELRPAPDAAGRPGAGEAQFRILGRSYDRLTARLALGTAVLVIVPLALGFYALSQHHAERSISMRRSAAELEGRILEIALRHQMMEQNTTLMATILGEIGMQPEVQRARILNHEGEVRVSSQPEEIGSRMARDSPACLVCHSQEPQERDRWALVTGPEGEVLRSVLPIENRSECHACHAPEERLNGILILDMSVAELQAQRERDLGWILACTAALVVFLLGGVGLMVRRLVLNRLAKLSRTARAIAGGGIDERAAVEGDDVITSLAQDFNNMTAAFSHLVARLRQQEGRLASVMNSLDDGLVVLDREARVVASNRSFCRRVGQHPEGLRGQLCHDADNPLLPCCAGPGECPASACVATGQVQRAVYQTPDSRGEIGHVEEVHASPIFDDDGEVVHVVELWRDITERVREEERLAEIERLASLGTLASGFSHEVNTPLASMLMSAETVLGRIDEQQSEQEGPSLLTDIRQSAEIIKQQALRCRKITEQFRRFSRGIPPTVEPLDPGEAVSAVVALVQPTAREARVDLRLDSDGPLPTVRANTEVVQHVLLNLLVNAIQSCGDRGGTVQVSFLCGDDVRIQVEDSGCGIPLAERRQIFQPMRSGKTQGTGLGLFLSRNFMRRFGGDVTLERSIEGEGSCFHIVFGEPPDQKR